MLDFRLPMTNCDGVSRRSFLRVGAVSLFGLTLPRLLAAKAAMAATQRSDVNCILLWTDGGMSNIDTLDMKPEAPVEYRGEFQPIQSNLPGVEVCEHLPHMARCMDKVCLVKSIAHTESGDHAAATHYMLTGYPQRSDPTGQPVGSIIYPMFGSVVSREKGWQAGMPPYIQLAGGIVYGGAGYIGSQFNPLIVRNDPNAANFKIDDVSIPEAIGTDRVTRRRQMLAKLDAWQQQAERTGDVRGRDEFYRQAFDLITSPAAKKAFRIDQETEATRDRYGRTREGQATLLARRLIEAGVRFVTVGFSGWDTHDRNFIRLKSPLLPTLDRAWSALLEDLDQRGLLSSTIVICAGEFGRTPRVNGAAGRDHYAPCNAVGLSGAGIQMGSVVGRTDPKCEHVAGTAHSTMDYAATIYHLLGIDYSKEYHTDDERPLPINNGGQPIREVLA